MIEDFANEDLISMIEKHPELWDIRNNGYKNREKKKQAWQAVCKAVLPDFEDKDPPEQSTIEKHLQTKWKSFRDCYTKSRKKAKEVKSVSSSKNVKPYVYSKLLSFLDVLQEQRDIEELPSADIEYPSTSYEVQEQHEEPSINQNCQIEDELIKFMRAQAKKPEEDADRLFLLSLLPELKSMNERQKRAFKIKVIESIDDIKHPSTFHGT